LEFSLNRRKDIDGLRALAVIAVIIYHAWPKRLPGGFSGVDVFFVISGYLITKKIYSEIQKDHFTLSSFFANRVKRLTPPLLFTLVGTIAIGEILLTSIEKNELSKQIISGLTFISNFLFWKQDGYFDINSMFKPLLHLWSLSLEEQFYLVWPILILFSKNHFPHMRKIMLSLWGNNDARISDNSMKNS